MPLQHASTHCTSARILPLKRQKSNVSLFEYSRSHFNISCVDIGWTRINIEAGSWSKLINSSWYFSLSSKKCSTMKYTFWIVGQCTYSVYMAQYSILCIYSKHMCLVRNVFSIRISTSSGSCWAFTFGATICLLCLLRRRKYAAGVEKSHLRLVNAH